MPSRTKTPPHIATLAAMRGRLAHDLATASANIDRQAAIVERIERHLGEELATLNAMRQSLEATKSNLAAVDEALHIADPTLNVEAIGRIVTYRDTMPLMRAVLAAVSVDDQPKRYTELRNAAVAALDIRFSSSVERQNWTNSCFIRALRALVAKGEVVIVNVNGKKRYMAPDGPSSHVAWRSQVAPEEFAQ